MPGMKRQDKSKLVAARLPESMLRKIDVYAGPMKQFRDKTEFIRTACKEMLEQLERYVVTHGDFKDRDKRKEFFAFLHNGEYRVVTYDQSIPRFPTFADALRYMGRGGVAEMESDNQRREREPRLESRRIKTDEELM